jgi:hypothetical protein
MPGGIKAVKMIYTILAWLILVVMVLVGIILMIVGGAAGAREGAAAAGVGFGMAIFYIIMGIVIFFLYFMTAKGVANKKNYGKIMAIIFGILMLFSIPIGTILGIIILINMFSEQGKQWFAGAA